MLTVIFGSYVVPIFYADHVMLGCVFHTSTERTEHIQTIITSAQDTDNVLPDKLCIWLIDKLYSE